MTHSQFQQSAHAIASGDLQIRFDSLLRWFRKWKGVIVAYSGGVDSTLLLFGAIQSLGRDAVLAVTAQSASLPKSELEESIALASQFSARQLLLDTSEVEDERYQENSANRCYYCKSALFKAIEKDVIGSTNKLRQIFPMVREDDFDRIIVVDGTNADDKGDIRPGMLAADEAHVKHPLLDLGFTKLEIRELSRNFNLPTWNKPEMACLASRIPTGTRVDAEKLGMIEAAESILRQAGFRGARVRYHQLPPDNTTLARIEIPKDDLGRFVQTFALGSASAQTSVGTTLLEQMRGLGFRFITCDLEGYKKGGRPN